MADDPLSPVVRGQVLGITAAAWNAAMAAARDRRQPPRPDRPGRRGPVSGYVEAVALNDTGADLREFKPAKVTAAGGYVVTGDVGYDWTRRPALTLDVPGASTDIVAVTLEAIPDGEYGRVAVAGWCLCDVDVSNSGHGYASPTTDTDALVSGATGSVRILATGTGTARRCAVYLGDQVAAASSGFTPAPTQALAGGSVTLSAASGVYTDILSLSLAAGSWTVWYTISGFLVPATASDALSAQLDLGLGGAAVAQATFVRGSVVGVSAGATGSGIYRFVPGISTTVKLQAARVYAGGAPTASIPAGPTIATTLYALNL